MTPEKPAQLSILDALLPTGHYQCRARWTNSMGHTWKRGDKLIVLKVPAASHAVCALPGESSSELRFHLNCWVIRNYFEHVRPLV